MFEILCVAPALAGLVIAAWKSDYDIGVIGCIVVLIIGIAPVGLPAAIGMGLWFGVGYGIATYGAALLMVLRFTGWLPDAALPVLTLSLLLSGAAVVFVIPLPLIALQELWHRSSSASAPKQVDVSFMSKSIGRIESAMTALVNNIEHEQARIAEATQQLRQELENGTAKIRDMQQENARMEKELQEKRALLSIDAQRAEAVEAALTRVRPRERLIGFIEGILSSLAAAFVWQLRRTN